MKYVSQYRVYDLLFFITLPVLHNRLVARKLDGRHARRGAGPWGRGGALGEGIETNKCRIFIFSCL